MEVLGKRDQDDIDKLLAAKAACEAANLPVPDAIAEQLGEGYEDKSPNELCIVKLPGEAVQTHQEKNQTGLLVLLDKIPATIHKLVVLP